MKSIPEGSPGNRYVGEEKIQVTAPKYSAVTNACCGTLYSIQESQNSAFFIIDLLNNGAWTFQNITIESY